MFAHTTPISYNFPSQNPKHKLPNSKTSNLPLSLQITNARGKFPQLTKRGHLQIRRNSLHTQKPQDPDLEQKSSPKVDGEIRGGGGGGGGRTASFLIFLLWGGLMYYVFTLSPNQTPSTDLYLFKKLSFLIGDDGVQLNRVIFSLWNITGLSLLVYYMLLIPSGRSSKGSVPMFPFVILSSILGAYALIPYFALWKPPPPPTNQEELKKWPLNFLESKLTTRITFGVGLGLIIYAGLASGDDWKEYLQYFGGSRLIHAASIDFALLSMFAPFWVYNDMSVRKWNEKGFWLVPLSVIPFLGPALYVLLRPSLSTAPVEPISLASKEE